MKKTLGGDRLGAGKKMQVDLHGFERSTHNLGYIWRSTMAAGTLVPFLSEVALPGDTFDINLDCDIKTHPTKGPLFGSYKVQLDTFLIPIRLYNSLLHNNMLGIGNDMSRAKIPVIELFAPVIEDLATVEDLDNAQVNPSCILSYLGIRGIGLNLTTAPNVSRTFNAIPILAYWEIYKNYYANKQEEIGMVIHTPAEETIQSIDNITVNGIGTPLAEAPGVNAKAISPGDSLVIMYLGVDPPIPSQIIISTSQLGYITLYDLWDGLWTDSGTELSGVISSQYTNDPLTILNWRYQDSTNVPQHAPGISIFNLSEIDEMRQAILSFSSTTVPFSINNSADLEPYKWLSQSPNGIPNILSTQEGLGLKTYQSDLFNNWLQTEWIDGTTGINTITAISTAGDSFTLDTLNLSKKVYDMLNRIAVSGGSYNDWQAAQYGHERYTGAESPMYMGGLIRELVFQEVVSNTKAGDDPLGTLAGKGIMAGKKKGGHVVIKVDEASYIMGIISLTPRIDYSQGNKWDMYALKTWNDLHVPSLDEIGFQELITEQMAWWDVEWDGTEWVQKSAGKQPAWINYMTNVNQTRGNFAVADNEMFMTLNRRYEYEAGEIKDLTTYIDPTKYNFIFAQTSIDAQNFWAQIAVDITARRKMSAKVMPNL